MKKKVVFKARRPTREKARIAWDNYRATVTQKIYPELDFSDLQAYFSTREWNDMSLESFKVSATDSGPLDSVEVIAQ